MPHFSRPAQMLQCSVGDLSSIAARVLSSVRMRGVSVTPSMKVHVLAGGVALTVAIGSLAAAERTAAANAAARAFSTPEATSGALSARPTRIEVEREDLTVRCHDVAANPQCRFEATYHLHNPAPEDEEAAGGAGPGARGRARNRSDGDGRARAGGAVVGVRHRRPARRSLPGTGRPGALGPARSALVLKERRALVVRLGAPSGLSARRRRRTDDPSPRSRACGSNARCRADTPAPPCRRTTAPRRPRRRA